MNSDNQSTDLLLHGDEIKGFFDVPLTEDLFSISPQAKSGLRFSLLDLDESFAKEVKVLLSTCEANDFIMVPYFGLRDVWEQSRLWRQSRSTQKVNQTANWLDGNDAPFLAAALRDVGPQPTGPNVTDALPGFSWHQHGKAIDVYRALNGGAAWKCDPHYKFYAETAKSMELTAGYYWTSRDCGHVQAAGAVSPGKIYSASEINDLMEAKFGNSVNGIPTS